MRYSMTSWRTMRAAHWTTIGSSSSSTSKSSAKAPETGMSKVVGHLSKRPGPGSGGEHRAPLYVIAGAALASAYRLDRGQKDGIRLMLLDEAFNKMDMTNIIATMRYLEDLGLQVFMASPGENQGILNAFLHRYYDIVRDVDNNAVMLEGRDVLPETRELMRSDLPEFNPGLIEEEIAAMRSALIPVQAVEAVSSGSQGPDAMDCALAPCSKSCCAMATSHRPACAPRAAALTQANLASYRSATSLPDKESFETTMLAARAQGAIRLAWDGAQEGNGFITRGSRRCAGVGPIPGHTRSPMAT